MRGTKSFYSAVVSRLKADIALPGEEPHLRATGRHLPYGITRCYLPPDTGDAPRLTLAMQAGIRFIFPGD